MKIDTQEKDLALDETVKSPTAKLNYEIGVVLLGAGLVVVITLVWFSFDYRIPTQDEAGHILSSMVAADLLAQFRPWQHHWWYQGLTISSFYPPTAYFINGLFLLIWGQSRVVEHLYMAFYAGLAFASVYGITRFLKGSPRAACISALCIVMYPAISGLSHTFFLDLPLVSMVAVAILALLWWRSVPIPTWWRTVLTGLVVGAACLTKQLAVVYIAPVGLYFFVIDIVRLLDRKQETSRNSAQLAHTIGLGLVTVVIGLPFIVVNYAIAHEYLSGNVQVFADKAMNHTFLVNLSVWCQDIPPAMSPFLVLIFIASVLVLRKREHVLLLPITLAAVGGLCATSASSAIAYDHRYIAPVLIAPAIFSGFGLEKLFQSRSRIWQIVAVIALILAVFNYLYCGFAPYPVPLPKLPWQSLAEYYYNPTPMADWGHAAVSETITKLDGIKKPVYLNLLSNHDSLHIHSFKLFNKEHGFSNIFVTGSRTYTVVGDKVAPFDAEKALFHSWYLWKTGDIGFTFYDQQSAKNFEDLVNFVRTSGNYKLVLQKPLPDGTTLMLYRRCVLESAPIEH